MQTIFDGCKPAHIEAATTYLAKRSMPAGSASTFKKLRRAARIAAGLRPLSCKPQKSNRKASG